MTENLKPFERFQGGKFFVLLAAFLIYSIWYVLIGPYAQLQGLAPGLPLQERGFYSGAFAVETLGQLNAAGRRLKYAALLFDIPFMVLQALLFEAMIVFGLKNLKLTRAKWRLFLILPLAFLLADFIEDSCLALTLATGAASIGTVAGIFTAVKFMIFLPTQFIALGLGMAGIVAKLGRHPR